MRHLFFKSTSNRILLSFTFSLFLVVTNCSSASEPPELSASVDGSSSPTSTPTPTESTTIQPSPPSEVGNVKVVTQDETSITLQWDKVDEVSTYILLNENNNKTENIDSNEQTVTHKVSGLTSGTEYSFILFTVKENISSSGYNFSAVTAPKNVKNVKWMTQNESSITLQWEKINNISTYRLLYENNGNTEGVNVPVEETSVTYVVSNLTAGTEYSFTLFTVFKNIMSSGYNFTAVTTPENVEEVKWMTQNESSITLQWDKINNISTYRLLYENNGNAKSVNVPVEETSVTFVVSNLTAGTEYRFTVFTVFKNISSSGYNFTAVTTPNNVEKIKWMTQNESSITLQWDKINNISTYRLLYENNGNSEGVNVPVEETSVTFVVSNLTAGTEYSFTLFTVFKNIMSSGYNFTTVTTPLNVKNVKAVAQDETNITLQWETVGNTVTYRLEYEGNEGIDVNAVPENLTVTYVVSGLTAGTKYNFTVFTVFKSISSSGENIIAVTAPTDTKDFKAVDQNETSITLQWEKVDGISSYNIFSDEIELNKTVSADKERHTVSNLKSAERYYFTLFTVFEYAKSSGENITAVTGPTDTEYFKAVDQNETSITLQWNKVDGISSYIIFSDKIENNETVSADKERHTVSNLKSAKRYNFTLITMFEYAKSSGENITAVTAPKNTDDFKAVDQNETSITLQWNKVDGISSYNIFSDEIELNETVSADKERHTVSNLKSAERYNFTLFTVFEYAKSSGENITAVTAPYSPADSKAVYQNETSILLQWSRTNTNNYIFSFNNEETNITSLKETIQHSVSNLESGTLYEFQIFSLFEYVRSKETNFTGATVPPMVSSVNVTERSLNSAVLKWEKSKKDWEYDLKVNGTDVLFTSMDAENSESRNVSDLLPGTLYTFSVITKFSGLKSTPYNGSIVTKINCESVTWTVTNKSIQGTVEGLFSDASASNESNIHVSPAGKHVLFTDLYPGATYEINLEYENLQQCVSNPKVTIIPPLLSGHCEYLDSGYSARIRWIQTSGVWTQVMVNISNQFKIINGEKLDAVINELQPAKTYKVTLVSVSGDRHSDASFFNCNTDNRGVIAGSVIGILIFLILVCVVFLFLKRPDIISRKKSFIAGSRKAGTKGKAISVTKFPDHFHQLSLDENRGFSQEYEDLAPVGTDQTRKAATLPENKGKNRFTNILPYDWCRVKLSTSSPNEVLDYINASYLPGYTRNREYIASQGPLPSTVKDFWRMIWEQKIKSIVMVTNCTEAGRIKCERYWPEELKRSCLYGELLVTLIFERKESNWTLREFGVKNKSNSEERTVKHFHFTAWPDHGVPQGTEVLIQFRGLVRRHIESDGTKAPTVVHCSAGVGRTGTIITLDVMLQQLEKERAVSINDFVRRMRQHRSHMVQTESQYVFLHQCIMDSLKQKEKQEENIYENADMIYENATALREFHNHKSDP